MDQLSVDDSKEPTADVAKSCCTRSQREKFHIVVKFSATTQREDRPFLQVAVNVRTSITRSRVMLQLSLNCERLHCPTVSTGERNALILLERWSDQHDVSPPRIFYGQAKVRDLGQMTTRRNDELDWSGV
jgi:hypothetical protein